MFHRFEFPAFPKALRLATLVLAATFLCSLPTTAVPQPAARGQAVIQEGELTVLIEDHKNRTSRTRHFLQGPSGKRYELHFKTKAPALRSGTKVRARGTQSGSTLTLESAASLQIVTEAISPNTFGQQNVLVLLVNFQDQPANRPWSPDQVKNFVFGTVSNFYLENSYRQTWLAGNVQGWYVIPLSSGSCDQMGIANYAKQAATAAGINLGAYSRYLYVFPTTSACPWSGTATVGGSPSQLWVNGYLQLDVVGHELGHNFGLYHSHSWSCSDGSVIGTGASCTGVEYGDGLDLMGWSPGAEFNAFQKERLGWLNYGILPPITTVQKSGTYALDIYETTGSNPKALKILQGMDPLTGKNSWYYVEYRQPIGFDSVLASSSSLMNGSNVVNGVIIHRAIPDESGNTGYLLDLTPATYDYYTRDPALAVGQTFTDTASGISITTESATSTGATVTVTLPGGTTCTRAKPSVLLSPSQGAAVAAGTPVTYTVALTNNDTAACSASTFNLQGVVPTGWSASYAAQALTVSPGGSGATTFTIISPPNALASTYSVGTTAANSGSTSYSATGSATYTVAAAAFATAISSDKSSYRLGDTVTLTARVSSGGAPVADASVNFTVTRPNGTIATGSAATNASGQATYKFRLNKQKDPVGTYQGKDFASSGSGSASATTSFSVQ